MGGPDSLGARGPSHLTRWSPCGVVRAVNGNVDVWLLELGRGVLSRFTSDAADDMFPIWSPDGTRIVFSSNRKGHVRSLPEASCRRRKGGTAAGDRTGQIANGLVAGRALPPV